MLMAGASGGFLAGVNDPWLKPRLLRAVVAERLPQPGGAELPPLELASVLDAVRTHGLLTEALPDSKQADPKLAEAWRAAVDSWVDRVVALLESDSVWSPRPSALCVEKLVRFGAKISSFSKDMGYRVVIFCNREEVTGMVLGVREVIRRFRWN
jgi:hypothetical protein